MAMPKRTRIDWRKPGGRMPANTVVVTRASRWGNPYIIIDDLRPEERHLKPGDKVRRRNMLCTVVATRKEAVALHREDLAASPELQAQVRLHLRGKDVACQCDKNEACHGDTLLEIANS